LTTTNRCVNIIQFLKLYGGGIKYDSQGGIVHHESAISRCCDGKEILYELIQFSKSVINIALDGVLDIILYFFSSAFTLVENDIINFNNYLNT